MTQIYLKDLYKVSTWYASYSKATNSSGKNLNKQPIHSKIKMLRFISSREKIKL